MKVKVQKKVGYQRQSKSIGDSKSENKSESKSESESKSKSESKSASKSKSESKSERKVENIIKWAKKKYLPLRRGVKFQIKPRPR